MPIVLMLMMLFLGGCAAPQLTRPEPSQAVPALASPLGRQVAALAERFPPEYSGFALLAESQEAFDARARLIRAAERGIDLQYYILEDGLTTRLLQQELFRAADRGVRVRLLLDDTVSDKRGDYFTVLARHPHIEVRLFNPVLRGRGHWATRMLARLGQFSRQHRRMHNKLLLADSSIGIVGGRNLGDEYFAADRNFNFADMDLLAVGPVARELATSFDRYWNHPLSVPVEQLQGRLPDDADLAAQRAELERQLAEARTSQADRLSVLERYRQAPPLADDLEMLTWAPGRALWDDPDKMFSEGRPPLSQLMVADLIPVLEDVEQELVMVSAYFVPTSPGADFLAERVADGARVSVLTNSLEATDVPAVHGGYAPYRERLLRAGVGLYELRPEPGQVHGEYSFRGDSESRLHSKAAVLDRRRVFVGTPNFDPRSVFWNTEIGLLVDSPTLAEEVRALIVEGMQPQVSYRVMHREDGELVWATEIDGQRRVFHREPGNLWRRFNAWAADVLGLESLL